MTNAMAALGIAAGVASRVCYAQMTRLQNLRADRGPSRDASGLEGGGSGGDGWSLSGWFGGD